MLVWFFFFFFFWRNSPHWARASSFTRSSDHTKRTTVGRTPLDEGSARRKDLYLTTHNIHNRETSMPPEVFEPTIAAGERLHTHALNRPATGTGHDSVTGSDYSLIASNVLTNMDNSFKNVERKRLRQSFSRYRSHRLLLILTGVWNGYLPRVCL